ncbi:glycosyltransferase family 2 protein [Sediminibacter sp. Hel_I_10]|uniref:glycosyltransferase family 2 protein n=1 Tax=Sediminibacter sp. Hel_I_10 TaxID=1392490 RepID=UPI00047BCA31|nr:glycosyltransferase family 2 protein [Sediminibacter sp. Hel_I_10]
MKVGLVITIKNEERILRDNLLYHSAIGVSNIFIYFDGSTDNSRASIEDLENVCCLESVSSEKYKQFDFLKKFTAQAASMHTARQCLNIYDATQRCKALKIDWLLAMDADELFLSDTEHPTDVTTFFEQNSSFDIIKLKPLEVISRKKSYENVFTQETLFKSQPRFKYWNDRIYFKFYDPYNDETFSHQAWLGHTMGKCAINVNSNLRPRNVHRFVSIDERKLNTISKGRLLHYSLYDFDDFKKKFHNIKHRPDVFLNGKKLPRMALIWRNLVNDPNFDDLYLENYFVENLLVDEKKLKCFYKTRFFNLLKRSETAVVEIDYVKAVFASMLSSK